MGQIREVDAIGEAITATEREIAGEAWDIEDTDPADETGDRALESMGDGLEGQHEVAEGDEDVELSEEGEGDGETDDEGEGETEDAAAAEAAAKEGEGKTEPPAGEQQPQGRVPSAKLREEADKRRAVETERDGLKAELETLKAQGGSKGELAELRGQIAALTQQLQGIRPPQPRTEADTKPAAPPDLFENPTGFVEHLQQGFDAKLNGVVNTMRTNLVQMSFENAGNRHGETFTNAMAAIDKLNPQNPADRQLVQSIYNSPNPGEALVRWHKDSEARREVGEDIGKYRERIAAETRQALLKDPEFRKALIADIRGEAQTGDNGSPRTTTRLPPSIARAPGASRLSGERVDQNASGDDEQSVADAAWR